MNTEFLNQPLPLPLKTDQYKANSHWAMLPKDVLSVDSYCEPRVGAKYNEIVFHGLQANILKNLTGKVITKEGIKYSKYIMEQSNYHENNFNEDAWYDILREYGGRLPIKIKAIPEGTITGPGSAWFTVQGLDDKHAWLSQRLEGLLMHSWYPTTIATRSRENIKIIKKYLAESSDVDPDFARDLYVDFGYRACCCDEQAQIGGTAHGISSRASDTIPALHEIYQYYGGLDERGIMYSVPATEHNIAQYYGKREDEYLLAMLKMYPNWILSLVSDTNNIEKFVDDVVRRNKDAIVNRWANGNTPVNKLVIRPDSLRFEGDTPVKQLLWIYNKLEDIFGVTVNSKNKKVLHPCIGVLWGDGISDEEIHEVYRELSANGYSVESQVVGQGGGLLVKGANRDTLRVAIKASRQKLEKEGWHDVIKDPLDKSKKSKAGELKVIVNEKGILETVNQHDARFFRYPNQMKTVFEMGEIKNFYTFGDIRKRAT